MNLSLLRTALVLAALGGCVAAGLALERPVVRVELPGPQRSARPQASVKGRLTSSEDLLVRAIRHPAFRSDRHPPATGYDPDGTVAPEAAPAPLLPRPALAISGIVWGQEPAVVVEGLPGVEGSAVLRRGDTIAGLRLVRIGQDSVVIRGRDTTWHLTVRNPWP